MVIFNGAATTGATKLAVAALGLVIVMIGSPGLTICCHWNGPFVGVLPVELSVTVIPAVIFVAVGLKVASALALFLFAALQALAGGAATLSGHGLSWPMYCVGCGWGTSARFAPS